MSYLKKSAYIFFTKKKTKKCNSLIQEHFINTTLKDYLNEKLCTKKR